MSAILRVFRGYRSSFEDDELVSSLRRLKENEQEQEQRPSSVEEVGFSNLLRDIEALIGARKKKEALMALVAARLRMNDLNISQRSRERFEGDFARLRAEIDAM